MYSGEPNPSLTLPTKFVLSFSEKMAYGSCSSKSDRISVSNKSVMTTLNLSSNFGIVSVPDCNSQFTTSTISCERLMVIKSAMRGKAPPQGLRDAIMNL